MEEITNKPAEEQKIPVLYQTASETTTIFDMVMKYLESKYDLRFNAIALEIEISLKGKDDWTELNINSLLIELVQAGMQITMQKLEILVRSHLIKRYNPLAEYFKKLAGWDGEDHIRKLAGFVRTNDSEAFRYHLEKWLTRAVLCALKKDYVNKQCLVLASSKQNTGKTTFLRFLIPDGLRGYYSENVTVDKDGIIAICKNFILNADELAVLSKPDVNTLKSFISMGGAKVRVPYGRKPENMDRICSFVASTNRTDFLTDETGSVRWLVFEVYSIDFAYAEEIDIDKVWAQAYHNAFERKNYQPEMTLSDIEANELRNEQFSQLSLEQEIVSAHFEKSKDIKDFLTATDIVVAMNNALNLRLNNIKVGKALTRLKYERIKHPKLQVYGYLIRRKID
ncbi:VapE domain-containing protein [Chryseobacterium indoltheticum]|uniref:Predicted P-loop ATPase and inactivated derivatives n=1 Tax=Chryseobacterium indoltheticum TaxID=254 RepID=A0A381FLL7_9FLAO|nr:VapE domain-containing protein [Chryseobacterium indoltheticum]SUX47425.1 Predicted P-loop ATPase and inactivated derivatives [Chryseobacterium indoltheticum]